MAQAQVDRNKTYIRRLRNLLLPGEQRERLIEELRKKKQDQGFDQDQLNEELERYT